MRSAVVDDLRTIRDWLRYAISRFNAAGLVYGHGTERALDEAAFLILAALKLPVDELEPWLEARLTRDERLRLSELIDARVTTRKPAPYLVGEAWIKDFRFSIDERAIVPRSYLGELMLNGLEPIIAATAEVGHVLDLCTGAAPLAIIAAHVFPGAEVDAVELSPAAVEVARRNVADYALEDRVHLLEGDLFAPVGRRRYDLILANPPYVTDAAVAAFPPEFAAEPKLAHAGGTDGLDLVRRIIDGAGRHLTKGGHLIVEIGLARPTLEMAYPGLPFLWLDTETSEGEVFHLEAAALAKGKRPERAHRSGGSA
ncbi:MAG: 50S ribosomal protein L3 N(5)-glutamine methyltransferase [Hyphomicrobiaceae bacterium]